MRISVRNGMQAGSHKRLVGRPLNNLEAIWTSHLREFRMGCEWEFSNHWTSDHGRVLFLPTRWRNPPTHSKPGGCCTLRNCLLNCRRRNAVFFLLIAWTENRKM